MYKSLIFISLLLCLGRLNAQDTDVYIRNYKDIAIAEMLRTGIPASIKLAQAMVESNCGHSELACKANNHFGIKCGGDWTGKDFHKEDDDYVNGELTKSCFRQFSCPNESFIAHSDFLTDPKKANRYGSLFTLKPTDYKGWARGLSRAGYATDPGYADKLIQIIEENKLYVYDEATGYDLVASPSASLGNSLVRFNNDVRYAVSVQGDDLASIADRYDVSVKQLRKFNDEAFSEDEILPKGAKVYLQPKRDKFQGKQKYHVLKSGQDLVFVAQEYGLKLSALQKRNNIPVDRVPAVGQKIMLKGKSKSPVRTTDPYQMPDQEVVPQTKTLSTTETSTSSVIKTSPSTPVVKKEPVPVHHTVTTTPPLAKPVENAAVHLPQTSPVNKEHVVARGETLFSIARQCGLSVDELKKSNNLSVDTIFVGQKLVIK